MTQHIENSSMVMHGHYTEWLESVPRYGVVFPKGVLSDSIECFIATLLPEPWLETLDNWSRGAIQDIGLKMWERLVHIALKLKGYWERNSAGKAKKQLTMIVASSSKVLKQSI